MGRFNRVETAKDLVPLVAEKLLCAYTKLGDYTDYLGSRDNPIVKIKSNCPKCNENVSTRISSYRSGPPRHRTLRTAHWTGHHTGHYLTQGSVEWLLGMGKGSGRKVMKFLTLCERDPKQYSQCYTWESFEQFVQEHPDLIEKYDEDEARRWQAWDHHIEQKIKDWETRLQTEIPGFPSVAKIKQFIKDWGERHLDHSDDSPFNPLATGLFSPSLTLFLAKLQDAIELCDIANNTGDTRLYTVQFALENYWQIVKDLLHPLDLINDKEWSKQFYGWDWDSFKTYYERGGFNFLPDSTALHASSSPTVQPYPDDDFMPAEMSLSCTAIQELEVLDNHLHTGERCLLLTGIQYEHILDLVECWQRTEEIEDWEFVTVTAPGDCNATDLMITLIDELINEYESDIQKFLPPPQHGEWHRVETRHYIPKTLSEQRLLVRNVFKKVGQLRVGLIVKQAGFLKRPAWQELIALHEACNVPILLIMAGSPEQNWSDSDIELFRVSARIHAITPEGWGAIISHHS